MKINTAHGRLHITIDTRRIEGDFRQAQKHLDQMVIRDTEPFVPFDRGVLRSSVMYATKIGSGEIIYRTPYAHYQYQGKAMVGIESKSAYARHEEPKVYNGKLLGYHTTGTGSHWFEHSKKKNLSTWINGVKKRLGG